MSYKYDSANQFHKSTERYRTISTIKASSERLLPKSYNQTHQGTQKNCLSSARDFAYKGIVTLGAVKLSLALPHLIPVIAPGTARLLSRNLALRKFNEYDRSPESRRNNMIIREGLQQVGTGIGGDYLSHHISLPDFNNR